MATPRGAEHRDLEQRLRDTEEQVRRLTSMALRRQQLGVTSGDFVVSGGGGVIVQDGGVVEVDYPDGTKAVHFGQLDLDLTGNPVAAGWQFLEEDGTSNVWTIYRRPPGGAYPDGYSSVSAGVDWFGVGARDFVLIGAGNVTLSSDGTAAGWSAEGDFHVTGEVHGTDVYVDGVPTTGSAANTRMGASGRLLMVTSSLRYKQDVEDAPDRAEALLSVRGRTWRDRAEVAEDPDTERRYVGFIAEELDEAGLSEYVEYDDEGRPEAIAYDRLTVPLLDVVRQQRDELAELRQQVSDLAARLDAIGA